MRVKPMMPLAGDEISRVSNLMGATGTERAFRLDPEAVLNSPIRTVIWGETSARPTSSFDRPGDQLASLSKPEVAAIGGDLNPKLRSASLRLVYRTRCRQLKTTSWPGVVPFETTRIGFRPRGRAVSFLVYENAVHGLRSVPRRGGANRSSLRRG
jgi:hypothetical protein